VWPARRALPAGQLLYERRNGNVILQITGHPEIGVPFGQDRIVPIFLATLSVRQKSQTIRFRSAAEMLDTFSMHKGGNGLRRPIAAFERIFGATMFFGAQSTNTRARVIQRSRFNFLRETRILYNRSPDQMPVSDEFENVVLSDEFYTEIIEHPSHRSGSSEGVDGAAGAPGLFMWLS
jgi:hypothetical protein